MGDIHKAKGDTELAEENYRKAIDIKSNYAEAYYKLGVLYKEKGKIPEAINNLWISVRLSKEDERYVNEFLKLAPLIRITLPKKGDSFKIGEKIPVKWEIIGDKSYLDYFTLYLIPKGGKFVKSGFLDNKKSEAKIDTSNLKPGEYYIRIYANSNIMKKYNFHLSYTNSDYFILRREK